MGAKRVAEQTQLTGVKGQKTEGGANRRGLTGTICPHEAHNLALSHRQVNAVKGKGVIHTTAYVAHFKQVCHRHTFLTERFRRHEIEQVM